MTFPLWQNIIPTPVDWPQKRFNVLYLRITYIYLKNFHLYPLILILIVFDMLDSLFRNLENLEIHVPVSDPACSNNISPVST